MTLISDHLHRRYRMLQTHKNVKMNIAQLINVDESAQKTEFDLEDKLLLRKRWVICPRNADRQTKVCCSACKDPICESHRKTYKTIYF